MACWRSTTARSPARSAVRCCATGSASLAARRAVRIAIGILFIAAGLAHFISAGFFERLVPAGLGAGRAFVNAATGALTIGIGLAFLVPRFRASARWVAITLLLITLPVTAYRALHPAMATSMGLSPALLVCAVAAWVSMILLVWWAAGPDHLPKV